MSGCHLSKRLMSVLAGGASLITLAYAQPALAQQSDQPAASGGGGLEEVVVTARRKEEKAQTVPITLNTFNSDFLENEQIKDLKDMESLTPGLIGSGPRDTQSFVWLRGVPGAVEYFDEMPLLNYGGYSLSFDTASFQVLKGPQGTLFGQSADAGAILYTTHPTVNDFEGTVMAEVGDYGHRHMEGVLNVPIVDDKLIVRVGGLSNRTDGFIKDLVTGVETGNEDYWIGRFVVTARPTDDFQNDFVLNYFYTDSVPEAIDLWYVWPQGSSVRTFGPGLIAYTLQQAKLGFYSVIQGTYRPGGQYSSNQTYDMVDTARWDLNENLTLKNILGYQQVENGPVNNQTSPSVIYYPLSAATQALLAAAPLVKPAIQVLYSDELQIQGKALNNKLSFTAGSFNDFIGTRQDPNGPTYNASYNPSGGTVSGSLGWGDQRTNGLYAQGTYDLAALADGLSITAGYRYTWDKQYLTTETFTATQKLNTHVSQLAYFKAPSYNLSLDYQVSPNTLVYVTNAKGYSKGGFNGGNGAYIPAYASFTPESVNNIEVGIKSDWEAFGVKARTNVGAYYAFYNKVQAIVSTLVPSPVAGVPPGIQALTLNAATAHIEGFDAEITVVPTDDLSITGDFGYVHFKYDTWNNNGTDWSTTTQYYTPQLQYNIRATYQLPVLHWIAPGKDLGNLSLTGTYMWTGHVYGTLAAPGFGPGTQSELNIVHAWDAVNLNLNWNDMFGRKGLDGKMYVTNLFQNVNFVDYGAQYYGSGNTSRMPYPPRMWGASLRYSFGPT